MLRDRLIFSLIYNAGAFMQSRNFRLQKVGDINWLERNYKFQNISFSLDELIIVDATKEKKDIKIFSETVKRLVNNVFIPVAAGGGIRQLEDAELLFNNGADKVILNSTLYETPELAKSIIEKYGSQSLVASVDYKLVDGTPVIYINDGSVPLSIPLDEYLTFLQTLGVGEILLNSIQQDGTGFGFDLSTIREYGQSISVPLLIMGGAGNEQHLFDGLKQDGVSAVVTANLFNFIGNGLPNARIFMLNNNANLARWKIDN
jgi:cyclase